LATATTTLSTTAVDASAGAWVLLVLLVAAMLAVDLLWFGRGHARPPLRAAVAWSLVWLAVALGFGAVLWAWQGSQAGSEYLTGYLLERSLSLDNVFVFAVILGYFAVPAAVQPRALAWGIVVALVLRLGFIVAGALLLEALHVTFYAFGALLLYTAYRLARHDQERIDPGDNRALRLLRRLPMRDDYEGERLFVRDGARRVATPLLAVLVVIATTDLVFAIDSIPAIFAVTTEPLIVFAANAFALLGLRALYFVLADLVDRFVYLSQGLTAILAFIGLKMLAVDLYDPPTWLPLVVVAAILAVAIGASLLRRPRQSRGQPVPGSV
jgi:TerC family integral membrane protein